MIEITEQESTTPVPQEFYGLLKTQMDALYEYFLNKPAKESLPYLKLLGSVPRITFQERPEDDAKTLDASITDVGEPVGSKELSAEMEINVD